MSKATQIGWFTLKEDKVFRNTYECAAWYEDILVKPGRYPVVVYDFCTLNHGKISCHISAAYTQMNGTIISDEFGARYFGIPIGDYDNRKNVGKPSNHSMMTYMYEVADSVLNNPKSPWELLSEFEAREIHGELNGKSYTTYGIYKI